MTLSRSSHLSPRSHRGLLAGGLALLALAVAASPGCVSRGPDAAVEVRETEVVVPPPIAVDGTAYEAAAIVQLPMTSPADSHGLHNVYRLGEHLVSGSEPAGEEAFVELEAMGIRTVLSVDGKVPDEALAAKYGMRYVHVPIQYSGMDEETLAKLAKTYRELPGPFYVHCFHGRHRGPAAAEIGRLVLDGIPRATAIAEMRQWCGTSSKYEGLYRCVAEAEIPTVGETKLMDWDFPAAHPFGGFRQAMVEAARADDYLVYLSRHDWQPTKAHPDLDPLNEASKLVDSLAQCLEIAEANEEPEDFLGWMRDSVTTASELRSVLERFARGEATAAEAEAAYATADAACTACHVVYRN